MNSGKSLDIKINVLKLAAFLYTNNEAAEREIKEPIPYNPLQPKTRRYPGISLTKEVEDLYAENYRKLMKEIEEDIRKWKNLPCSWIRTTNIVKMSILPKAIYTFNAITIRIAPLLFKSVFEVLA